MPPESHSEAIAQARATQRQTPIKPTPLPTVIQVRDPKTGQWTAGYADGSINRNARKTFDAAVPAGHDVRSLNLPSGLSAGEVAMLGPVGDPYPTAIPDLLQPRRVGDKAGALKDNDVGYLKGQVWSYPEPKKDQGGPVKILFSVLDGAERVYYVGGDRIKPKELFRSTANPRAVIIATGRGLSKFYWQRLDSGAIADSRYPGSFAVGGTLNIGPFFDRYQGAGIWNPATETGVSGASVTQYLYQNGTIEAYTSSGPVYPVRTIFNGAVDTATFYSYLFYVGAYLATGHSFILRSTNGSASAGFEIQQNASGNYDFYRVISKDSAGVVRILEEQTTPEAVTTPLIEAIGADPAFISILRNGLYTGILDTDNKSVSFATVNLNTGLTGSKKVEVLKVPPNATRIIHSISYHP